MTAIQVSLTDQELTVLEKLATEQHLSIPELARKMVVSRLQTAPSRWNADRRRRALLVVGAFSSECRDLSVRHDDYLNEAYDE